MDLRRFLVVRLAGFFAVLGAAIALVWLLALHQDAVEEQAASSRLADLLLAATRASHGHGEEALAAVQALIDQGGLRHVQVTLERDSATTTTEPGTGQALPAWLVPPTTAAAHRVPLGTATLVIRPDPRSEVVEKWRDSIRLFLVLLLFATVSLVAAWYAVHRALSPVRELELGLARLERGETDPSLPRFELREFERIARAVEWLATSLAQSREVQGQLTRRLLEVQEAERRELARELHDEFGQSLAAIGASAAFVERHAGTAPAAQLAECAQEIGGESRRIAGHVRSLLAQLRPHGLEGLGIAAALDDLASSWQARSPEIALDYRLGPLPTLSTEAGLALYRVLQEALTNVLRHSGARLVRVACGVAEGVLRLSVEDDGRGRVSDVLGRSGGGFLGMRERLSICGGALCMEDVSPRGLRLVARIPL